PSLAIQAERERHACPQKLLAFGRVVDHPLPRYPIRTVPTATTVPTGRSAGSLQVRAGSPFRAAGLPLISTVGLPSTIVARLDGGLTKLPPLGTCAGVLVAVLCWVAAGAPMMLTSLLSPPSSTPANGCGSGTGVAGGGGWIMCMSVATTW